jgi:hypothetical protein
MPTLTGFYHYFNLGMRFSLGGVGGEGCNTPCYELPNLYH